MLQKIMRCGKMSVMALIISSFSLLPGTGWSGTTPPTGVTTGGTSVYFNLESPSAISSTGATDMAALSLSLQSSIGNPALPANGTDALSALQTALQTGDSAGILTTLTAACQTIQSLLDNYSSLAAEQQQAVVAAAQSLAKIIKVLTANP